MPPLHGDALPKVGAPSQHHGEGVHVAVVATTTGSLALDGQLPPLPIVPTSCRSPRFFSSHPFQRGKTVHDTMLCERGRRDDRGRTNENRVTVFALPFSLSQTDRVLSDYIHQLRRSN